MVQETGTCEFGEECHFAHSSAELLLESVRNNFVEKSIEGDDTKSQSSIDDSVDLHGTRCIQGTPHEVPLCAPHQTGFSGQALPHFSKPLLCKSSPARGR